jgi:hypothetical protein
MTLNRAKDELGIDVRKNGPLNDKGEATWQWHAVRPEAGPEPAQ